MKATQLVKIILSCCIFLLTTHATSAANSPDLTCPTAEQIHQFSFGAGFPYGFNNESKRVKFFTAAEEPAFGTKYSNGDWFLFIYPIEVQQSEQVQAMMKTTLEKLLPYSSTPFQFNFINEELNLPFCVYTLPDNNDVNAIAYFVDYEFNNDGNYIFSSKLHAKESYRHQRIIQIAKQLFLK